VPTFGPGDNNFSLLINWRNVFMSNNMRWRYGDTNPVVAPTSTDDEIAIGDLVYQESGVAKPASAQADQGAEASNQALFHQSFLGVAMQASPAGSDAEIRVATTGVFELDCAPATFEIGEGIGPAENAGGDALENQTAVSIADQWSLAIGRCAKRVGSAGSRVLVDIVSVVTRGGPQAAE
jgi:hypothetical protein